MSVDRKRELEAHIYELDPMKELDRDEVKAIIAEEEKKEEYDYDLHKTMITGECSRE